MSDTPRFLKTYSDDWEDPLPIALPEPDEPKGHALALGGALADRSAPAAAGISDDARAPLAALGPPAGGLRWPSG